MKTNWHLPEELNSPVLFIAGGVKAFGGHALIVGGWVRDQVLGIHSNDIDIEVYNINMEDLGKVLDNLGFKYCPTGKTFGIYKLSNYNIDVSVPRRENRIGVKHTDFSIDFDPKMTPFDGAQRRDFTCNSMYWNPITKELSDPCGGLHDIKTLTLKPTNIQHFGEDPLRVLRAMQFIARFEFTPSILLIEECKRLQLQFIYLSKERIYEEWKKMILKGTNFTKALNFLRECNWIYCFPELEAMIDVPQEPEWHPEGDVWTHIGHCMDAFGSSRIIGPRYHTDDKDLDRLIVGFGVLLHDIGKPSTTLPDPEDGRIRAKAHDKVGVPIAEKFLRRMTDHEELIESVLSMVGEHMFTAGFNKQQMTARGIKRLARRCDSIDLLCYVIQCDKEGRPPLKADLTDIQNLRQMAVDLNVYQEPPQPIMMGRHLIAMGLKPSNHFGLILKACQGKEDEGLITDVESGKKYVQELLDKDINLCPESR